MTFYVFLLITIVMTAFLLRREATTAGQPSTGHPVKAVTDQPEAHP